MVELLELPLRYFSTYVAAIASANAVHQTVWALLFCGMLVVMAWLARRHAHRPSWGRLAAVCACLAVGMKVSNQSKAGAVPAVRTMRFDPDQQTQKQKQQKKTPTKKKTKQTTPWLTE